MSEFNMDYFCNRVLNLLDFVQPSEDPNVICASIMQAEELVVELSGMCKERNVYKDHQAEIILVKHYINESNESPKERLREMWIYLLQKFAHAPTTIHAQVTALMLIPLLHEYLEAAK